MKDAEKAELQFCFFGIFHKSVLSSLLKMSFFMQGGVPLP